MDFEVPDTIQPRELSRGGGIDGLRYRIFTVNFYWNADNQKWNVNDWKLDENGKWNAGNQVLSPLLSLRFSHLLRWEFCFQAFFPAAKHSAHLTHIFREFGVLLGIDELVFPTDLEEELEEIEFANGRYQIL